MKKDLIKISLIALLSLSIVSCSWTVPNNSQISEIKITDENHIAVTGNKKGAEFSVTINENSFSTQANANGTPGKQVSDIDHYLIYLIKNSASSYPAGGDPLGTDLVSGPFTVSNTGSTEAVKFTGVPSAGTDYYYVAVRARDSSNNDLVQDNNGSGTAWTGTTASTPKVAVTSSGVQVDSNYQLSSTNSLAVTLNLIAGAGARIDGAVTINNGSVDTPAASLITYSWQVSTLVSSGLNGPRSAAVDSSGNVFIAGGLNAAIKRWNAVGGTVDTLVSSGLFHPYGVALDSSGNAYIADTGNNTIKRWNAVGGTVDTLVNSGLYQPWDVALDGSGNVYISDTHNHAIKRWNLSDSTVDTLINTGLNQPTKIAVDNIGNLYIADYGNNAIKRWNISDSTVDTLVSTGLNQPYAVAVDSIGNAYIADTANNAIKRWNISDNSVETILNTGLNQPRGLTVDSNGIVYIADTGNNVIKKLERVEN